MVEHLKRNVATPYVAAALACALIWLAGAHNLGLGMLPTLLLLAHLLVGRMPAEQLIERLSGRAIESRPSMGRSQWRPRRPAFVRSFGSRGGELIAARLSGRSPPGPACYRPRGAS